MGQIIQHKRGAKATLPILKNAEAAITTDSDEFFIGNGTTNFLLGVKEHSLNLNLSVSISGTLNTNTLIASWTQDRIKGTFITYNSGNITLNKNGLYSLKTFINLNANVANRTFRFILNSNNLGNLDYDQTYTNNNLKTYSYKFNGEFLFAAGDILRYYFYNTNATSSYALNTNAKFSIRYQGE